MERQHIIWDELVGNITAGTAVAGKVGEVLYDHAGASVLSEILFRPLSRLFFPKVRPRYGRRLRMA